MIAVIYVAVTTIFSEYKEVQDVVQRNMMFPSTKNWTWKDRKADDLWPM